MAALCRRRSLFRRDDIPHLEEHCLEVQLPFLARLFPGRFHRPVLVGKHGCRHRGGSHTCLALIFAGRADYTAFIVSANMASYMTGKDIDAENAAMEELLAQGDWSGVLAAAEKRRISACGAAGIAAVLSLAGRAAGRECLRAGAPWEGMTTR